MSEAQPQLALERIYTKDISFEVPGAQVFTKEWQPELNINLSSSAEKVDPTHYEVSLKVVVQANNAGDTAFIVDVTQAGIFLVDGVEEERLPYILGAYCPNILFPFLREAVNDMVTKGSFHNCYLHQLTLMLSSKKYAACSSSRCLKVKLKTLSPSNIKKTAFAVFFIVLNYLNAL